MSLKLCRKVCLLGADGRVLGGMRDDEAELMIARGIARADDRGRGSKIAAIRLMRGRDETFGIPHPCRTRISSGLAIGAGAGNSQVYTQINRSTVGTINYRHKSIFPEDLPEFYRATGNRFGFAPPTSGEQN